MLVTFRSPAFSDVTMFGHVALGLLEAMGHSGTVPGALAAEDVGPALSALQKAVQQQGDRPLPAEPEDPPREEPVTLGRRALPLLAMLAAAQRAETYVSWDV
jgi:hypothetical protein